MRNWLKVHVHYVLTFIDFASQSSNTIDQKSLIVKKILTLDDA